MRLFLLLLALLGLPLSASAADYFRMRPASAVTPAVATPPSSTAPETTPPDMSNDVPSGTAPSLPPGMGDTDPSLSTPHNGLLKVAALPGWTWDVTWNAMPANLDQVQVYANGSNTWFELTVRLGPGGCALATMVANAATGFVSFSTFRDDSHAPCLTPTTDDWAAITGQAFPSRVRIVSNGSLPGGNGSTYTDTSASFATAH